MKRSIKGFTLVEMLMVIVAVGVMGSVTARLLYQGSDLFIHETNRQSFVNEVRSTFWRISRESHGQVSKDQFYSSNSNILYLKHADTKEKQILINSPLVKFINDNNNDNIIDDDDAQYTLSNYPLSSSDVVRYYDNNYNEIEPLQSGLSEQQSKTVHLIKIDITFNNDEDDLNLSSYIFPQNFKYGEKMGYHD